jgi:hypothetical protein
VKRKRSALVDGELHMTWQHGRAVGRRRVWWWWPADWYRLAVDREFRYWLRRRGCAPQREVSRGAQPDREVIPVGECHDYIRPMP